MVAKIGSRKTAFSNGEFQITAKILVPEEGVEPTPGVIPGRF